MTTTIQQLANETLLKAGIKEPDPKLVAQMVTQLDELIRKNIQPMVKAAISQFLAAEFPTTAAQANKAKKGGSAEVIVKRGRPKGGQSAVVAAPQNRNEEPLPDGGQMEPESPGPNDQVKEDNL